MLSSDWSLQRTNQKCPHVQQYIVQADVHTTPYISMENNEYPDIPMSPEVSESPDSSTVLDVPLSPTLSQMAEVKRSKSALPEKVLQGRKSDKQQSSWIFYMTIGFTVTVLLASPAIYIYYTVISGNEPIWYDNFPIDIATGEAYRWSLMSATFVFWLFMSMALFSLAPAAFKHAGSDLRACGQIIGALTFPLGFWFSSVVTCGHFYFLNLDKELVAQAVATVQPAHVPQNGLLYLIVTSVTGVFIQIGHMALEQRAAMLKVPITLVIFASGLLIEKTIMMIISYNFHRSFYTKRILENNMLISTIEALNKLFPEEGRKPFRSGAILDEKRVDAVASAIFKGLLKPGNSSIVLNDLLPFLEHPKATDFFDAVDSNQSGDLTEEEFREAFRDVYDEKRNLIMSLKANEVVINKIDNFLIICLLIAFGVVLSESMSESIFGFIFVFSWTFLGFKVVLDSFAQELFNSSSHFVMTHPYDIGDRILLKGKAYRVQEMNLWMTTLADPSGRLSYVTNSSICGEFFGNYRRSDRQAEMVYATMPPSVSLETLEALRDSLNEFVKSHHRFFTGRVAIKQCQVENSEKLHVGFGFMHQGNFNNVDAYRLRRGIFFDQVRKSAASLGVPLHSLRFTH